MARHAIMRLDLKTGNTSASIPSRFCRTVASTRPMAWRRTPGTISISWISATRYRPRRRRDRRRHDISDSDTKLTAAPHHARRARPVVVRRIRRQQAGNVRHQDGNVQGVERADALYLSVRRVCDKHGELWSAGMASDRVLALIRKAVAPSNICCRGRPISGVFSSTIRPIRSCSGPATITAPKFRLEPLD